MTEFEDVRRQRISFDQVEEYPVTPWYERASYLLLLAGVALAGAYVCALFMFSLA